MSNLAYLGVAIVLSVTGWLMLWLRNRRPRSTEASIREFSRELKALAPADGEVPSHRRRTQTRGRRSG
jgi:hypothetical protein